MASSLPSTVLVVDDEAGVRDSLAEALRVEGHACVCFADSIRAVAYLSKAQRPADLLLTDLSTPEVGGDRASAHAEVAQAAARGDRDVRIV